MQRLRTWDERVRADRGGSGAPRSVEGGAETPVCLARFREGPSGRLRRDLDGLVEIYRKLLFEVVDHKITQVRFCYLARCLGRFPTLSKQALPLNPCDRLILDSEDDPRDGERPWSARSAGTAIEYGRLPAQTVGQKYVNSGSRHGVKSSG
jgi:hypothetical protein